MLIIYITKIMFLAAALNNLRSFEPNVDRQKKLAETLKNPEKLAKVEIRIEFLTACRKNGLTPRFIEDAMRPVRHLFRDMYKVGTRCDSFARTLLNEAIAESFRSRAYLVRQRARLLEDMKCFLNEDRYSFIYTTCGSIFNNTIRENRPRLVKKFINLKAKSQDKHVNKNDMDEASVQKRVKNLSSKELDASGLALLAKGPNFATTQTVSKAVLLQVEKGVERFAYAKRWKDKIKRCNQTSPPNGGTEPIRSGSKGATTLQVAQIPARTEVGPARRGDGREHDGQRDRPSQDRTATAGQRAQDSEPKTGQQNSEPTGRRDRILQDDESSGRRGRISQNDEQVGLRGGDTQDASGGTEEGDYGNDQRREGCMPNLSFRFPDVGKNFSEPSSAETEKCLQKLKDDIIRTYKNHKVTKQNVDEGQRRFIKDLANDNDIIIKQSDKCKGFVILDKTSYLDKAKAMLDDRDSYEGIEKNPVPKVEARAKRTLVSTTRGKLPDKTIKELTPGHSRTPVFYGLPKDHKPSVPLRPVISACGGPTEKTSCLLERILKQLLKFVPTHLWDTKDFLQKLSAHSQQEGTPEGSIFFSIDVVNLYGSIPVNEAINAVKTKLGEHEHNIDTFGLSKDDISVLLEQSLGDNVFSFNNAYYRQKLGLAMGNPCAPPLAILFLDQFERKALAASPLKPAFLARYIDDYAGIWTHGLQALKEFLAFLNSQHPNLSFTMEHSGGDQGVPFLDTLVTVEKNGNISKIETELFIKPTNSGIILHSTSAHPKHTKHNIIRNMFHRAYNNSSSEQKEDKSINKIRHLLLENGYTSRLLNRLLREVQRTRARRERGREGGKGRDVKRRNGWGDRDSRGDTVDGFLTLPYMDEQLLQKVKHIVGKSKLRVRLAWKNDHKLKTTLVRSSFGKPTCPGGRKCHLCMSDFKGDCTVKNIVYEMCCKLCKQNGRHVSYVGESMRPVRLRFNEHRRDAINRTANAPFGDHFISEHTDN